MGFSRFTFDMHFNSNFVYLFIVKKNLIEMEVLAKVAPWIVLFLVFTMLISLCIFYIKKLIQNWREEKTIINTNKTRIIPEQREKIKAEIISDLEKKLEAL